ncbi:hypothetical protein CsSME_00028396 [Camellia sinensis var. sinensis]
MCYCGCVAMSHRLIGAYFSLDLILRSGGNNSTTSLISVWCRCKVRTHHQHGVSEILKSGKNLLLSILKSLNGFKQKWLIWSHGSVITTIRGSLLVNFIFSRHPCWSCVDSRSR